MDELAQYNIERWQALANAQAVFTRPALNLDPHLAQAQLDPERRLGDVAGKDVLCLPDAHADPVRGRTWYRSHRRG